MIGSDRSGDRAFSRLWCGQATTDLPIGGDPAERARIIANVSDNMGLHEDRRWLHYTDDALRCEPTSWGGRLVNAAHFLHYVAEMRDQDTLPRRFTRRSELEDGTTVTNFLSQWIRELQRDDGYTFECRAGSNVIADNYPLYSTYLYYPWFWGTAKKPRNPTTFSATCTTEACAKTSMEKLPPE